MPTFTTNYSIPKPVPGADADTWGAALNSGMDIIDTQLAGRVSGASALTTPGSVPFVTAAGVLGSEAAFAYDAATNLLTIANGAALSGLGFGGSAGVATQGLQFAGSNTWLNGPIGAFTIGARTAGGDVIWQASTTTRNLLLGTTTDGGFKLDVADSGSSGGLRVWDQRATIGSTSLVVRAGAGQGGNRLWQTQDSAGNTTFEIVDLGGGAQFSNSNRNAGIFGQNLALGSGRLLAFSSTTTIAGTPDLSLSRASANTLQVGDGGANANGTINAARVNLGTNATVPLLIGGTGVLSTLTLRSTSGVGTTGADIIFQTGNNGATEVMRLQNNGNVGIGTPTAGRLLDVRGLSAFSDGTQGLIIGPYTGGSGYGMIYRFGTTPDGGNYVFGANGTETILNNPGRLVFAISGTERARIEGSNFKFGGTADRATTAGTNQVVIYDGTAPVGTLAGGCSFYSTAGEMRVMDGAGNATLLSPHDRLTNEWIYDSTHTPTGRRLKISVEKLLRFVDEHFGLGCILEEDPSETMA